MSWSFNATLFISVILLSALAGLIQYKKLDKASKAIVLLLTVTFITECLAIWAMFKYEQNNPIYNISSLIRFLITTYYFNNTIEHFRKKKIGIKVAALGSIVFICNTIFLQGLLDVNSFYLAFESITIAGCCLYYFYEYLSGDTYSNKLPVHFWFTSLLLIFWSFTFFYWLIAYALMFADAKNISWLSPILFGLNIFYYSGFAVIFLFYKKLSANE